MYPYPHDHGAPVRCECGWWYTNLGHGRIVEEFRPRIGGAKTKGPEKPRPSLAQPSLSARPRTSLALST